METQPHNNFKGKLEASMMDLFCASLEIDCIFLGQTLLTFSDTQGPLELRDTQGPIAPEIFISLEVCK